jgi:hypothetical protein
VFKVVPARNGAPLPALSFQSSNFPDMYLSPTGQGAALGIVAGGNKDDASWTWAAGLSDPSATSLVSLSTNPSFAGKYVTFATTNTAPCNYVAPDGDAVLSAGADAAASTLNVVVPPPPPPAPAVVGVDASAVDHVIPPRFLGCHME